MKNMENYESDFAPQANRGGGLSVKDVMSKFAYHWPLFLLTIGLSLALAYYYLATQENMYTVRATLQIKDGKGSAQREILEDIDLDKESKSAENEIEILRSQDLMVKVVKDLGLWTDYSVKNSLRTQSLYNNSPVKFSFLSPAENFGGNHLSIKLIDDKTFAIVDPSGAERKFPLNTPLKSTFGKWTLQGTEKLSAYKGKTITLSLYDPSVIAESYMKNLKVALLTKNTPFINLLTVDAVPKRGEDVLNHLMKNYSNLTFSEKEDLSKATLDFVNRRIDSLSVELGASERAEANFRSNMGVTDLASESQAYLDNVQSNDAKLNELEVQLAILSTVENSLKTGQSLQGMATIGGANEGLSALLSKYSDLELERERLLVTTPENSPVFEPLNRQLALTKSAIKSNISNTKASLLQSKSKLRGFNSIQESSIKNLPGQERQYVTLKRNQATKENLYVYLLNKREQIALNYATTVADSKVVNSATTLGLYSPKRGQIYAVFFLIGLIIPVGIVFARIMLISVIVSRKDIENKLDIPLLGEVIYNENSETPILRGNERSALAEHFKFLRTNLHYVHSGKATGRVNLITSSVSGEGKSFIAANIAASLGASGRKTVLLELDLRKPKLLEFFDMKRDDCGISNYLDGTVSRDKIIKKSGVFSNLDVISCGTVLPNPTELLERKELEDLIQYLKGIYDDIIIDSPPLHLVTDALILSRFTDTTLYVIRQGITKKAELNFLSELYYAKKLPKLNIVFNGIQREKFGYGYNYDNSYYVETISKSFAINKLAYNFLQRF